MYVANDGYAAWGLFTIFFSWLFWIGIVAIVIHFVLQKKSKTENSIPIHILKERYAKGEIDSETYQKMLDDLKKDE